VKNIGIMTCAYIDCFAGISGDMMLGALVDLGMPVDLLTAELGKLALEDFRITTARKERMGIHGASVRVIVNEKKGVSRDYKSIRSIISKSPLSDSVKALSLKIFGKLAGAEARIHNVPEESVHFHEVGSTDAIVDIVGTAVALEWHGIEKITASEIPVGKGFLTCAHGVLPVPAPATIGLLSGVPTYGADIPYELVTPTGASILTSVADSFGAMPQMVVDRTGYGVGSRDLESIPNLLRIILGKEDIQTEKDRITVVETNIDDMNPEIYGFVMEKLFGEGALDVALSPIAMKKNRPGTMIRVICQKTDRDRVIRRILLETTATGVRYYEASRVKLQRKAGKIATKYGSIRVKHIIGPDGRVSTTPEYEDCRKIAIEKGIPILEIYKLAGKERGRNNFPK
jgi:hypothetical protein